MENQPENKKRKVTMTFLVEEKENFCKNSKVTKVKVKNNSQDPSQEIPVEVVAEQNDVAPIPKYRKPSRTPRPASGILSIQTTPDDFNSWADSTHILRRNDQEMKSNVKTRSARQKALLNLFMPTIGKSPDASMQETDWPKLIEFSKGNGGEGVIIIPGKTAEFVNGKEAKKQVLETRLIFYNGTVCFETPHNKSGMAHITPNTILNHQPFCNYPNCLSSLDVTFRNLRCKQHKGVERFGVTECYDEEDNVISIFSSVFSYSINVDSSQTERLKLFQNAAHQSRKSIDDITEYLRSVNKGDMSGTLNGEDFGNSKEAENYLSMLQTTRLLAKMNGGKINGKEFRIINKQINLAYKCENKTETFLLEQCKTRISCKLSEARSALPTELGRPFDKVNEEEGYIYMQYDLNVNYSGIKIPGKNSNIATTKTISSIVGRYEKAMTKERPDQATRYKLDKEYILINNLDSLKMTEDVVNMSNYIGHMYKLDNPLTGDEYICLNKKVYTEHLVSHWHLVKGFVSHFFSADVNLTDV